MMKKDSFKCPTGRRPDVPAASLCGEPKCNYSSPWGCTYNTPAGIKDQIVLPSRVGEWVSLSFLGDAAVLFVKKSAVVMSNDRMWHIKIRGAGEWVCYGNYVEALKAADELRISAKEKSACYAEPVIKEIVNHILRDPDQDDIGAAIGDAHAAYERVPHWALPAEGFSPYMAYRGFIIMRSNEARKGSGRDGDYYEYYSIECDNGAVYYYDENCYLYDNFEAAKHDIDSIVRRNKRHNARREATKCQ